LEIILGCFARNGLRINLMQNSAVSFQVCVDNDVVRLDGIMDEMKKYFTINFENGLDLLTIRYYDSHTIEKLTVGREVLLEQKNGINIQMVLRRLNLDSQD
jgi:aspartate kinase